MYSIYDRKGIGVRLRGVLLVGILGNWRASIRGGGARVGRKINRGWLLKLRIIILLSINNHNNI